MTNKEREKVLLECYKDNQAFIDKLTLTAALGSIPLALGVVDKVRMFHWSWQFVFVFINICAIVVVIAHIVGAVYGKKACEDALENKTEAIGYDEKQKRCNKIVNISFVIMVVGYLSIITYLICGG